METARADRYALAKLALVIASLTLNVWGNVWGAPARWNADEITGRAIHMVRTADPNPHYFTYGGLHYYVTQASLCSRSLRCGGFPAEIPPTR